MNLLRNLQVGSISFWIDVIQSQTRDKVTRVNFDAPFLFSMEKRVTPGIGSYWGGMEVLLFGERARVWRATLVGVMRVAPP